VTVRGSPYRARRNELLRWHYTGIGLARADSILHTTVALNGGAMQAVQDALDVTCETVETVRATVAAVTAAVISAAVGCRCVLLFCSEGGGFSFVNAAVRTLTSGAVRLFSAASDPELSAIEVTAVRAGSIRSAGDAAWARRSRQPSPLCGGRRPLTRTAAEHEGCNTRPSARPCLGSQAGGRADAGEAWVAAQPAAGGAADAGRAAC
jgi:hypothetical protein